MYLLLAPHPKLATGQDIASVQVPHQLHSTTVLAPELPFSHILVFLLQLLHQPLIPFSYYQSSPGFTFQLLFAPTLLF